MGVVTPNFSKYLPLCIAVVSYYITNNNRSNKNCRKLRTDTTAVIISDNLFEDKFLNTYDYASQSECDSTFLALLIWNIILFLL